MVGLMTAHPLEMTVAGTVAVFVASGVLLRRLRAVLPGRQHRVVRARRQVRFEAGHAQVQPARQVVWQQPSYVDPDVTRIVRRGDMPTAVIPRQRDGRRG